MAIRQKSLICLLLGTCALAACSNYGDVNNSVAQSEQRADAALSRLEPTRQPIEALTIDRTPFYGATATPISNGTSLPPRFLQPNSVVITFPGAVTLTELAQLVQGVTGVRVQTNEGAATSTASNAAKRFLPGDGEVVTGGRVVWQGRLPDLLDQAADYFGGNWAYDGVSVTMNTEITRTFMLQALATTITSDGEIKSASDSGSTGGSTLPEGNVKSEVSIKIWDEIKESVNSIMGGAGRSAFSPSTGSITVSGSPLAVRRVEQYLNQQNAMRLRRVSVSVSVLDVTISNKLSLNTDATGLIRNIFKSKGINVTGGGAGLNLVLARNAGNDLSTQVIASSLEATEGISRVAISHSGSLVTLSDQPAPLQVGRQISYLARTSSTSSDTGTSVSLEPGQVNVGLLMNVLPRIVETNKILMRVGITISNTSQPFPTFGRGADQIQLPEIESTGFMQNAVLQSGETLVLAGFEREENSAKNDGIPGGGWLGADRSTTKSRQLKVLLLNAEIMPEDPITVTSN